jgi:hypothetical protein
VFGLSVPGYAALYSVAINFAVTIALAPLFDYMARRSAQSAGL